MTRTHSGVSDRRTQRTSPCPRLSMWPQLCGAPHNCGYVATSFMWPPSIFLQEIPCDWPDDGHITPPSSATETGLNGHRLRNDVLAVFARHAVVGASRLATLAMIAPVGGPLRIQVAMLVMWRSKSRESCVCR